MIQQERDIDGLKVLVTMLPFDVSNPLLWELLRKAAPILGMVQSDAFGQTDVQEALAPIASQFFANFPPAEWEKIRDTLFRSVVVQGVMANGQTERVELHTRAGMNQAFTGRQLTAMKVVLFALEVNFRDFYDALARGLQKALEILSQSPNTSETSGPGTSSSF